MDVNSVRSHSNEKQPVEHSTSTNGEHKHTEKEKSASVFINHGEYLALVSLSSLKVSKAAIAWHESRREWTGDQSQQPQRMIKDPIISWSATYEDLLSTHEPFSEPIPLPEYDMESHVPEINFNWTSRDFSFLGYPHRDYRSQV
ncbi:hypothetical protein DKX38_016515 [Salix brachista]|uniref:Uncharacterized protein n=1 Tax=Salix brachista TaxID=2182728 RepID=A0A5N5L8N6_9ROSI|nr:hypothetical protein DKX38_016515 [Salix brachista]